MKRNLIVRIAAFILALCLLSGTALATSGGNIAAESRSGVVRILMLGPDDEFYVGTAFGVGKAGLETTTFVTNYHVVNCQVETDDGSLVWMPAVSVWIIKNDNAYTAGVGFDLSQMIPCDVIYSQSEYPDLAIIEAIEPVPGRVALPLVDDEDTMEAGDTVYALGYPGFVDDLEHGTYGTRLVGDIEDVTITSGIISRFSTMSAMGNTRLIQHDAQINHGNSGGPLLNEKGGVIGINTYAYGMDVNSGDSQNYYSVRIKYAIDVLDELGIEYDTQNNFPTAFVVTLGIFLMLGAAAVIVILLQKKPAAAPAAAPAPAAVPVVAPVVDGLRIQGVSGAFANRRFAIGSQLRIGRDPNRNDLAFPAATKGVSGAHCILTVTGGQLYLTDLGSTYGTYLGGGQRLAANQPMALRAGDRFWLGTETECFIVTEKGGN